jgi:hypothetical protein
MRHTIFEGHLQWKYEGINDSTMKASSVEEKKRSQIVIVNMICHFSFVNKVFKTMFYFEIFYQTQLYLLMDYVFL